MNTLAQIDTGPGWLFVLAVVAFGAAFLAVDSYLKADAKLDADIEYALNCDAYCMVVVCGAPATGFVHGWATCDEHRVTA